MDAQQKEMLLRLMELQFAATELNLYLDTHPDDMRALQEFRMRSQELMSAKMEYERIYGPLLNFGLGMTSRNSWQWIQDPWPWEVNWRRS
ncbi:MAG: spore coat protein CotJB [Bacillota bacterium]|jgi:spore coat protein JB|nr:spore coat protein CotJB [Candidatus Fermentithermobacillaceae bacterium]HAF67156.1 spore coat protein CotJB [Clostridiales bacterium UBA9857]HOA70580.1 spore coat protein CotJB [Bacillota bacterium]HOP70548.1 spore coat protein CotJB [Bacillota bacterium]HPT34935.1 spore coat protein CotJB [Bacillota bacterium]